MLRQRYLILIVIGVAVGFFNLGLISATASSTNISHSYHSKSNIVSGSIVSLDSHTSDNVILANSENSSRLIGVAVDRNSSLLVLGSTPNSIQVAESGTVNAIVSTIDGAIIKGDLISVSPFNGVGMKADQGYRIIGQAQTDLNSSSNNLTSLELTDKTGNKSLTKVGYVRINIAIGVDTIKSVSELNSLQKLAQNLTGHPVSAIRIAFCLIVALLAIVSLMVLIYTSIHTSIIAIGRNPLAKVSIYRNLVQTLGVAILTAILACIAIFSLLL
jgi:hypothetical protein